MDFLSVCFKFFVKFFLIFWSTNCFNFCGKVETVLLRWISGKVKIMSRISFLFHKSKPYVERSLNYITFFSNSIVAYTFSNIYYVFRYQLFRMPKKWWWSVHTFTSVDVFWMTEFLFILLISTELKQALGWKYYYKKYWYFFYEKFGEYILKSFNV